MIYQECPKCGKVLSCPADQAGQFVRCQECRLLVEVRSDDLPERASPLPSSSRLEAEGEEGNPCSPGFFTISSSEPGAKAPASGPCRLCGRGAGSGRRCYVQVGARRPWTTLGWLGLTVAALGAGGHLGTHAFGEAVRHGARGNSSPVLRCLACERCYRRARRPAECLVVVAGLFVMAGVPSCLGGLYVAITLALDRGAWIQAIGVGLAMVVAVPLLFVYWLYPWTAYLLLRRFVRRLERADGARWGWRNPPVSLRVSWRRPEGARVVDLDADPR